MNDNEELDIMHEIKGERLAYAPRIPQYVNQSLLDKYQIELEMDDMSSVHNWRNHVPDRMRGIWDMLTDREKLIVYWVTEPIAENEEWD